MTAAVIDNDTDAVTKWDREIQKVARKAAFDWPGVIEQDDLAQDIVIKIIESPGTVEALSGMDNNSRYQTLHKIAQRLASEARTEYELFSGNFRYSVDEVRSLLEAASNPEAIALGSSWSVGDHTRSGGGPSDATGNAAISNIVVSDARKQLTQALADLKSSNIKQYEALVQRFIRGIIPDSKDTAAFMVIDRALTSLTTKMNHGHKQSHVGQLVPGKSLGDGPGTRTAISNASAFSVSAHQWDGDYVPAVRANRDNHIEPEVWA